MSAPEIKVRGVIACEDLRQEADGKAFAIGIMNPVIGRGKPRQDGTWPPLKLHFILLIDVPVAGAYELRVRLRPSVGEGGGSTAKLGVEFTQAADNIPLPVGPLRVRLDREATEFFMERAIGTDEWERIAGWRLQDMFENDEESA